MTFLGIVIAACSLISPAKAQMDHSKMDHSKMGQENGLPKSSGMSTTPNTSDQDSMPSPMRPPEGGPAVAAEEEEVEIPKTPPPPPPKRRAADRFYDPHAMDSALALLRKEHGGDISTKFMANLAEYQATPGGAYRWEGEAWVGGDINRFVAKSEGEGSGHDGVEGAEVQALYSRAIGPYTDLQAGVRYDFQPRPSRTYGSIGIETLLPYWFEVEATAFLSTRGELLARLEGSYDLFVTQRFILQPRVELNFAAQDARDIEVGSGLSTAELGLRLRYDIKRNFAPYIGVSYERRVGETGRLARTSGRDVESTRFVMGLWAFF